MIDFHCHLDLYPDPGEVIEESDTLGIYVLAVTTTPRAFPTLKKMLTGRKRLRAALGLHPELAAERAREVDLFPLLLPETDYVGEIGLDGSPAHRSTLSAQTAVFTSILGHCQSQGGRILSIHSRGAETEVLDCLQAAPGAGTPILHWFSGKERDLDRAIQAGCWFSVGPAMLRSKNGQKLAARMPPDRVLTETDGPFGISGGQPLKPWDVDVAERQLADLWGVDGAQVSTRLRSNLRRLLERGSR